MPAVQVTKFVGQGRIVGFVGKVRVEDDFGNHGDVTAVYPASLGRAMDIPKPNDMIGTRDISNVATQCAAQGLELHIDTIA